MCDLNGIGSYLSLAVWYLQGLLTPVIAGIAVYIARQQWKTNAYKVKLDLFDKRFRVFEEVRNVLYSVRPSDRVKMEEFVRFRSGVTEAYFLFGPEIEEYIEEIFSHAVKMNEASSLLHDKPDGYDPEKLADEGALHLKWLVGQWPIAKERFKKYLDVSKL